MAALTLSEITKPVWKTAGPLGIIQRPKLAVNNNAKSETQPSTADKIPGVKWLAGQIDNARTYEIPKELKAKSVSLPMFPFVDVKADLESTTGAKRERTIRLEVDAETWKKLSVLPLVARRARYLAENSVTSDKWGNVLTMSRDFFKAHDGYGRPVSTQSMKITMKSAGEYVRGNQLAGGVDGLKAEIDVLPVLNIHEHGHHQRMKWADQILPKGMARALFTTGEEQERIRMEELRRAVIRGPQFGL